MRGVRADPDQVDVTVMLSAERLTRRGNAAAAHRCNLRNTFYVFTRAKPLVISGHNHRLDIFSAR